MNEKSNANEQAAGPVPFPEPFPEKTGFGPIDADNAKEWRKDKAKWEREHGTPTATANE